MMRLPPYRRSTVRLWRAAAVMLALAAGATPGLAAAATNSNARPSQDYAQFQIIPERNIFNPNRRARSAGPTERRETRRAARVEYVTLLGTMSYGKGPFAFFEGSSSELKKVAQPGDKIAGYGVAAIELKRVMLNAGTNWIELPVGKQLRREDQGPWRVADAPERQIASASSSSSGSAAYGSSRSGSTPSPSPAPAPGAMPVPGAEDAIPMVLVDPETGTPVPPPADLSDSTNTLNAAPEPAPAGDENEVLRRLMQRREEEINR